MKYILPEVEEIFSEAAGRGKYFLNLGENIFAYSLTSGLYLLCYSHTSGRLYIPLKNITNKQINVKHQHQKENISLIIYYYQTLSSVGRGGLVVSTLCSQPIHDGFESWSCTTLCHHVISLGKEFTHIAQVNSAYYQLDGK